MTRAFTLAGLVALVLVGCGGGGDKAAQTTSATHGRYRYSSEITSNYMRTCVVGRATRAYCACTLDKLSENVSTKDFQQMALAGGHITPRIRRVIVAAARACRDKL